MARTINISEFSQRTGISKQTLIRMLRSGEAPGRKIGREWRILDTAVDPFIEKYMTGGRE